MYIDELYHYGTPQMFDNDPNGSGRFRQGSGKNPGQHTDTFEEELAVLRAQGLSSNEIAKRMNFENENEFRAARAVAKERRMRENFYNVRNLKEQHPRITNTEIGKILGISESAVRGYLKKDEALKKDSLLATMDMLEDTVQKKKIVDVSKGVEKSAGLNQISEDKLMKACKLLRKERGYNLSVIPVAQLQDYKNKTNTKVLSLPEYDEEYIKKNIEKIQPFEDYQTIDNGDHWYKMRYPTLVDRKRIYVRYAEEGGKDKDGTIELRRGVPDLDLVGKQYAQVRIGVEGNQYMKGMAYMSDTVPKGYDIVYNSNKPKGSSDDDVFKPFKTIPSTGEIDKDNPFGAVLNNEVGQRDYPDPKTGEMKLSPVNIVKPAGEWSTYRKDIPAQFLSKQEPQLIKQQLNEAYKDRLVEYSDIMKVSNQAVKQKMLEDFGDNCDKAASELRGAALPRQSSKVLLPVPSLKDNEVYAPQYDNGEEVALVRFPCEGLFEVPKLKVNNNNAEGKRVVTPTAPDAIGINTRVANQLSGADFDGDAVMVLPCRGNKIKVDKAIEGLVDFDTKSYTAQKDKDGNYMCKIMTTDKQRNQEMGIATNLITDMTLIGADTDELVRATKFAMVIIDAKKHKLDYKQAEIDFDIPQLHKKYQGKTRGGASTIVSRATGEVHVPEFRELGIDPHTGERIKKATGKNRFNKKTESWEPIRQVITKMESVDDAYDLVSNMNYKKEKGEDVGKWVKDPSKIPNAKEYLYADFANSLKSMGNKARLDSLEAGKNIHQDKEAAKTYSREIESIKNKLDEIDSYSPRERQAQRQAAYVVRCKVKKLGGDYNALNESGELAKIKDQTIAYQRHKYDSKRPKLELTAKEWEAVSKNACTKTMTQKIMRTLTPDALRGWATPASTKKIPAIKITRMKRMLSLGYTVNEIAKALNISPSTVEEYKSK